MKTTRMLTLVLMAACSKPMRSVDAARSTVTVDRAAGVVANGSDSVAIAFTALDGDGEPMAGAAVELEVRGAGTALSAPAVTDAQGASGATLTATRSGVKVIAARIGGVALAQQPTVTFVADPATLKGAVSPSRGSAVADGVDEVRIWVSARDANDNPLGGISVELTASGTGNVLSPAAATDGAGNTSATLRSTVAGSKALTVVLHGPSGDVRLDSAAAVDFIAGNPVRVAFAVQPGNTNVGVAIAPPVRVAVRDLFGNVVTSSAAPVTIALANNASGAALSGTLTANAAGGVAGFADLALDETGLGFTLTASAEGLAPATSAAFDVRPRGAATTLWFVTQPPMQLAAGAPMPALVVEVRDGNGSRVWDATGTVELSLANGPSMATLAGTLTAPIVVGQATFSGLSAGKAGTGYTLSAAAAGLNPATSGSFDVVASAAARLAFSMSPATVHAGELFSVTVELRDAAGNLVSGAAPISLSLGANPSSASLTGTLTETAVAGVATFSGLSIDQPGFIYTLEAAAAGLSASSGPIAVAGDCALLATLSPELEALQAAMDDVVALGLVGQPAVEALYARSTQLTADLAALGRTCSPAAAQAVLTQLRTLTMDGTALAAAPPLGMTSSPTRFIFVGDTFSYLPALAGAPPGFTFSLTQGLTGATFDPATGAIAWQPAAADKGPHDLAIQASDGTRTALQRVTIVVAERRQLLTAPLTSQGATITLSGTNTPLDGTTVRIPAGLVTGTDALVLSMIDPAPPAEADVRIVGPALEVQLASGANAFRPAISLTLPAPRLLPGELPWVFRWAPPATAGIDQAPSGTWSQMAGASGTAAQVGSPGTVSTGTTAAAPASIPVRGYLLWASPQCTHALSAFKTRLLAAHDCIVTRKGYLDPSLNGLVTVSLLNLEPGLGGQVHDRFTASLNCKWTGADADQVAAHELFHVVQFHNVELRGHGTFTYRGGAMWWMESTADLVGYQCSMGRGVKVLHDPYAMTLKPLTLWEESVMGSHQYDSYIFFDFLERRYGFNMLNFWLNISASTLMGSYDDGRGRVETAASVLNSTVTIIPYLEFVHAYNTARGLANFPHILAAENAPTYPLRTVNETPNRFVQFPPERVAMLSSRAYYFGIGSFSVNPQLEPHLWVSLDGGNVEARLYRDGDETPLRVLAPSNQAQDVGVCAIGQRYWIDVANRELTYAKPGGYDLSVRVKQTCRPPVPPVVWSSADYRQPDGTLYASTIPAEVCGAILPRVQAQFVPDTVALLPDCMAFWGSTPDCGWLAGSWLCLYSDVPPDGSGRVPIQRWLGADCPAPYARGAADAGPNACGCPY